jgi:hypothetical protein
MIEKLRTYWELRKLRVTDSQLAKAYEKDRLAAKAENKGWEELEKIADQERFERSLYWDQASKIQTRKLCGAAARIGVPIPTAEDCWEESGVLGGRHLSEKGFSELRSSVRKEKNERWAYWELRVKVFIGLATAVTGVAGALIGLAAILGIQISN